MRIGIALAAILATLGTKGADAKSPGDQCLRVLTPLDANAIPRSESFEMAMCPAGHMDRTVFRYDRALGLTRATRAIAAAEVVPAYLEFGEEIVVPGQLLRLRVASGAVRVQREVKALQRARSGQRLFVKSADGEIFSVIYERGTR